MSASYFIEFLIIDDFLVSTESKVPENFFLNILIIFFTLCHSIFDGIIFDPGLVDSSYVNYVSTKINHLSNFFNCFFVELYFPPSEKLSGVKFIIPINIHFLRFKNFLFEIIFFISDFTLRLIAIGRRLIFLILIILELTFSIIS